jgi:hypothetical protein
MQNAMAIKMLFKVFPIQSKCSNIMISSLLDGVESGIRNPKKVPAPYIRSAAIIQNSNVL